jgi:hypothetical protein
MKNIPSALKAHYKSRFTTTCTMWHITMTSGDELFFTDHDKDIIYEEELYVSAAGFSTTALESHSDLSVDNINIESFVSDQSGINVGTEEGFFVSSRVERFVPKFWTVDGPRSSNFCLTTAGRSARVDFTSRLDNDLVGLIWASEDTHDHRMLAYATNRDYRGCVLDFDLTVGGSAPAINDVTKALALTINGRDAAGVTTQWIIPLFRYMNPNDITSRALLGARDPELRRAGVGLQRGRAGLHRGHRQLLRVVHHQRLVRRQHWYGLERQPDRVPPVGQRDGHGRQQHDHRQPRRGARALAGHVHQLRRPLQPEPRAHPRQHVCAGLSHGHQPLLRHVRLPREEVELHPRAAPSSEHARGRHHRSGFAVRARVARQLPEHRPQLRLQRHLLRVVRDLQRLHQH